MHSYLGVSIIMHISLHVSQCVLKKPNTEDPPFIRIKKENQGTARTKQDKTARTKLTLYNANSAHWHSRGSHHSK